MHIYKSHGIIKNYKEKLHLYNVALAPYFLHISSLTCTILYSSPRQSIVAKFLCKVNLPDFSIQIYHWSPKRGKLIQTSISENISTHKMKSALQLAYDTYFFSDFIHNLPKWSTIFSKQSIIKGHCLGSK